MADFPPALSGDEDVQFHGNARSGNAARNIGDLRGDHHNGIGKAWTFRFFVLRHDSRFSAGCEIERAKDTGRLHFLIIVTDWGASRQVGPGWESRPQVGVAWLRC